MKTIRPSSIRMSDKLIELLFTSNPRVQWQSLRELGSWAVFRWLVHSLIAIQASQIDLTVLESHGGSIALSVTGRQASEAAEIKLPSQLYFSSI